MEGLLSTGPTPSSCLFNMLCMDLQQHIFQHCPTYLLDMLVGTLFFVSTIPIFLEIITNFRPYLCTIFRLAIRIIVAHFVVVYSQTVFTKFAKVFVYNFNIYWLQHDFFIFYGLFFPVNLFCILQDQLYWLLFSDNIQLTG